MFGAGEWRIARSSALGAPDAKSPSRSPGVNERKRLWLLKNSFLALFNNEVRSQVIECSFTAGA
jgi:hypothetical protein